MAVAKLEKRCKYRLILPALKIQGKRHAAVTISSWGKKPAVFDSRTLRLGAYLTSRLPAPPAAVDWGKNVSSWPMYLNDKYGDCTCAAVGHMLKIGQPRRKVSDRRAGAEIL